MEARAGSESGVAAAGARGLQNARRGRTPAEGREEEEAADGALRSLARMLPGGGGPVARVLATLRNATTSSLDSHARRRIYKFLGDFKVQNSLNQIF